MGSEHVVCPVKITSPWADEHGMVPNLPCGLKVPVVALGEVMTFRCSRGHRFTVGKEAVQHGK